MIAEILKAMGAGGLAAFFIGGYLQSLGLPGVIVAAAAGAVGGLFGWAMAARLDDGADDGLGYADRRRG